MELKLILSDSFEFCILINALEQAAAEAKAKGEVQTVVSIRQLMTEIVEQMLEHSKREAERK